MRPRPRIHINHLPIQRIPLSGWPPRHPIILRLLIHRRRVRRPPTCLSHLHPAQLAPRCNQRAGLQARHLGDVQEAVDDRSALHRIHVLHPGKEHAKASFHKRRANRRVQWLVGGRDLQPGGDAADGLGEMCGLRSGDAGGDEGGGRHGGVHAGGDDATGVVHDPDTSDGPGAVLEGDAEGGVERGCEVIGKGVVTGAETMFEEVEGVLNAAPFGFGFESGFLELEAVFVDDWGNVDLVAGCLHEAIWGWRRGACGDHAVHRRLLGLRSGHSRRAALGFVGKTRWRPSGWGTGEHSRRRSPLTAIFLHDLSLSYLIFACKVRNPSHQQDEMIHCTVDCVESSYRGAWRAMTPSIVR